MPDPQPFERALHVLAGTPAALTALVGVTKENQVTDRRAIADGWSPREILVHLLVVERDINPPRLHRLAAEDGLLIEPPQTSSAPPENMEGLLRAWARERARNLAWLRKLAPETRAHASIHPRHGRITLEQHVIEWAYHDLDHLRQLVGILGADLYPHMGNWQTLYAGTG
ncbi:MAG: DinB family protein [Chloroflexi bacterium]|nr:DinB family protein [Chloroflexota bacterium]